MYGVVVSWCSRIQKTISESTSEAELKALCEAAHEILYLYHLTKDLLYDIQLPITVYEDNVGAQRHCELTTGPKRVKHVELKLFKVNEYVQNRILHLHHVTSEAQLAGVVL